MKSFRETFKDRIDCSDGSAVIRESDFIEIQKDVLANGPSFYIDWTKMTPKDFEELEKAISVGGLLGVLLKKETVTKPTT